MMDSKNQSKGIYDVAIIGSGPAGHTAAIYLSRGEVKTVMYEGMMAGGVAAGGQLTSTTIIENFPGIGLETSGPDLMDSMRLQSAHFGTIIKTETVTKVDFSSRPFKLWTEVNESGEPELAKAVVVATGATAKRLNLKGEEKFWQSGISACAVCDGAIPIFRNKVLCIIGGGDSACEEALYLTKYASKVVMLVRKDHLRASNIMAKRVKENPKVEILYHKVAVEAKGSTDLLDTLEIQDVNTKEISELKCNGLFYAIGHQPNTDVFKGQLETDEAGYIILKSSHDGHFSSTTSVEGVFAAGDVHDSIYRQAITAAGAGCKAALDCLRWLEENSK